jgi:flavin reductase (DIM6/NTAB) family NADH-FMN oxidoreductase RutF
VRVTDAIQRGDHIVVVGEVIDAGLREGEVKPLILWDTGWFYGG